MPTKRIDQIPKPDNFISITQSMRISQQKLDKKVAERVKLVEQVENRKLTQPELSQISLEIKEEIMQRWHRTTQTLE